MKSALLMIVAWCAFAQSPGVTLRIETADGRTQFRIGEAISLKLTFDNPSGKRWRVPGLEGGGGRSALGLMSDRFPVSPREGTADPWLPRLREGAVYSGPGGMGLGAKQTATNVDLNEWVRFERPGLYRVSALLHAGFNLPVAEVALNSNEIEIEIVPADKEWLAEQLRQAVAVLDAPAGNDPQASHTRAAAIRTIWYLDTPESLREAARLLGTLYDQSAWQLQMALRGSEHQAAAIGAMNQLLRAPEQAVSAAFIQTLAMVEAARQFPIPGDPDAADPDGRRRFEASDATAQQLRGELASVVERKRGEAKAISLDTALMGMRFDAVTESQRAELATVFMDIPWQQQSQLLGGQWKTIASSAMIPVLREIYENPSKPHFESMAPAAVKRLYELDPAHTRTLIIDDMKHETPRLPFETLAILDDATLPEMDAVLLNHLQRGTGPIELIARYATAHILDGVKDWYAKQDAMLRARRRPDQFDIASSVCQPALIGYYLRVDPAWGEQVLRGALNDRSAYPRGGCWMGIVGRTAKYQAGPAWEKVAIEALADSVVAVKSDAVKALGEYGSAAAQQSVMDAFRGWHDWWKDKPGEMVSEKPYEQAFFQTSARAKNWIANGEELEKIREFCITSNCREQGGQYIRMWAEAVPVSIGESGNGDVSVSFAQYEATSLDAARVRLRQVPAGTRLKWNLNARHTPEIDAWIAAVQSDLVGRGVSITP
jgi:hypothetical protein